MWRGLALKSLAPRRGPHQALQLARSSPQLLRMQATRQPFSTTAVTTAMARATLAASSARSACSPALMFSASGIGRAPANIRSFFSAAGPFRLGGRPTLAPSTSLATTSSTAPATAYQTASQRGPLGSLLGGVRTWINGKVRLRFKMKKHQYLKNVKRVRYISVIPQYTGPLGRQTKKRPIVRDYRQSPRLR
eukprot:CAMPEP_0206469846 /NCGR_PEP_ID=MMETSP0324_2-20121206/30545_1 /ASSEMBLY_ACC=CAM_ASM_000836 /TAXON_ID=2866 /ORGANISM="Crypthecodinium cohnii, Strain Seligo" /LENGTH=191 /DNA_ID=CAMNT_0053943727 /DNA_START=113 /DNA_END=685 /DNA_ORIENTATION=-